MGYDIRMHVGRVVVTDSFLEIARLDLCKIGHGALYTLVKEYRESGRTGRFFADDGNNYIEEDRYGDKLPLIPAEVVMTALREDMVHSDYRRYDIAASLIDSIARRFNGTEISCLFFGH